MNLAASLIVRNELSRYLRPCIEHLLDFCDQICVVDDGSTDETAGFLNSYPKVRLLRNEQSGFYTHEGRARQQLLDWTLGHEPTHVLSIDADEFVADGSRLRALLEADPATAVWQLNIEEIWKANEHLYVREDGGWRTHGLLVVWKAPAAGTRWTILDRKLACRRVPTQVLTHMGRAKPTGVDLLHYGWANPAERQARYDRYTRHDGGRFHANAHLKSIMWADSRIKLREREWPQGHTFARLQERFTVNA